MLQKSYDAAKNQNRNIAQHYANHHGVEQTFNSFGGISMENSSRAGSRQVKRRLELGQNKDDDDDEAEKHPVPTEYKTLGGKQFYWPIQNKENPETENFENMFFVLDSDRTALAEACSIFVDGTFRIASGTKYSQLIVISQRQFNKNRTKSMAYPTAMIFMTSQSKEAYSQVWNQLEEIVGTKINVEKCITDLELGLVNSLEEKFPLAMFIVCAVHAIRSWDRKKQKLGLQKYCKNKQHTFYHHWTMIRALPYVDCANPLINSVVIEILDDYENACPDSIKDSVKQFHSYLVQYYLELKDSTRFHPTKWATRHVPTSASQRLEEFESSTNLAEGLNSGLNKLIPKGAKLDFGKAVQCIRQYKRQKMNDLEYLKTFDRLPKTKKMVIVTQILRKT